MDASSTATPFYAAIDDATSCVDVLDPYDAMILEYIEEKHIAAYSLLSHDRTAATQPHHAISSTGVPSQNTLSTNHITTEDNNDLPIVLPSHLAWMEDLHAIVASLYPTNPEYEDDDIDWSVALSTYDNLDIEEAKHATAVVRVPWREVDHLAEWKEETEVFAAWWDLLRETEHPVEPATVSTMLIGSSCLDSMQSLLVVDQGHIGCDILSAEGALDELLPGLRGLETEI